MGEKQQENKGRKTEKNKEKKIELEKDEMEFHKSKKKDKVVSKDAISDDVVGALKIAGVEGEENTNARSNGRKDSVDDSEERKEKKKKRKEKKKKEGVDGTSSEVENSEAEKRDELVKGYKNRGGVPVENGEEERAKKNKKKKKEKEGSDNEVKNSMTNEETLSKERNHLDGKIKEHGKLAVKEKNLDKIRDNVQKGAENGDVAEVSNDKDGGKSKKKKKKKKIREREDAYDEVEDEMEVDEEGDKSKMKKKRKMENDDEMKTNEEGDRIKKKERKRDSVSGEVENEMKTNEEREESKKKKERKKENSSAEVEDEMQTNEEGEKSKKKERKRENASNEVENNMKTNVEGEKSKKKKRSKKEIVSDDVEDQMKTDEEVDKSKKTRKREYVSADVEDKPEIDERDNSKKNKKRKREIVSGDVEDKLDELGKGDGGSKDKKKKGKAEKQVSSGEAHKGKAIIEKDIEDADTFENPTPQGKSKRVSFSDHVEVFLDDSPSGGGPSGGESISDQGEGLVHGKWFTPKEDDLLQKAVLGYIEDHNLGDDGLHMILNCMSYPQVRGCWKEISAALPWRPVISVYYRGHILFERDEKRKWTAEEYEYIRDFVNEHGADWKTLSTELKKHRFHCKDTWRRIKQINLKKGCWAQEEYQTLFDLVNMDLHMRALEERKSKHGMLRDNICWGAISDRLTTRSDATCCTKWYSQLTSPMVQQGLWSDTDDYRLLNALISVDAPCLEDVDWDNLLDHRDGDMCRKRWNQMVKHIGEYGLKTFSEQVEVLANRYSPDCIEAREEFDSKPILP